MDTTLYFNSQHERVKDSNKDAMFKVSILKNPNVYKVVEEEEKKKDDDMFVINATLREMLPSKSDWNNAVKIVQQRSDRMCKGVISRGFFSKDNVNNTSVIFLLYILQPTRHRAGSTFSETLIGFALTIDLRRDHEDHYPEEGTLYIDAICTNTDVRYSGTSVIRGAGTLLMNSIEQYAVNTINEFEGEPFNNIKLSALPYVISYYRKLGYRHVHSCKFLERRHDGELIEHHVHSAITELAETEAMRQKFPNNDVMDNAIKIELAKKNIMIGKQEEQTENLIADLNKYFRGDDIIFTRLPLDDIRQGIVSTQVIAIDRKTRLENAEISELIQQDNKEVLEFLNVLRHHRFAVGCSQRQGRTMRHFSIFDKDKEIDFPCLDEGFTMRKCLQHPQDLDEDMGEGKFKRKQKSKYNNMKDRRKRKTRKKVHWADWSNISPKGHARTVMKKKCGKKCFLGPKHSFPVCAKGTCNINKKGLWSAYIRAREWGKNPSSYKGRARPRHSRRTYKRIAKTAKRMLKSKE